MKKSLYQIIIWIIAMTCLTSARVYISKVTLADSVTDCYETDVDAIVSDNLTNTGYIYKIQDNKIENLYACSAIGRGIDVVQVYETDDNIYALVATTMSGTRMYNVIVFDMEFNQVQNLGWVTFSQEGQITDLEIFDSSIYIAQLSSDGRVAYKYITALGNLKDEAEKLSMFEVVEANTWNAGATADYDDGSLIADAYLEKGQIVTMAYSNDVETHRDAVIAAGRDYLEDAEFTAREFNIRFRDEFLQMAIAFIIGLALILLLPHVLKNRNRIAYMVLFWELILAVLLATYWLGYDTFCKYATPPILFVAGTLLGGLLFWFQGVDLHKLAKGMREVVENNGEIEKDEAYGQDMNFLWNALVELGEKIKKINYSKYQMYEACYRFAPKGMEKFLKKDSIADVREDETAHLKTTVALTMGRMFAADNAQETSKAIPEQYMELISSYQENKKGVLVSMSSDMYRSCFLFAEDYHLTQNFGNEYFSIVRNGRLRRGESGRIILFHHCEMTYGIVGNKQQGCQYIYSPELNELEQKLTVLSELGLEFVMTKAAYDAEEHKPTARYVGELQLSCMKETLPLYQVLDSMPSAKRSLYRAHRDLFENGIELMRQNDYYLARNAFAEELRVLPEDGMARWYLYLCEKYLDNADEHASFVIK